MSFSMPSILAVKFVPHSVLSSPMKDFSASMLAAFRCSSRFDSMFL
jgi:hypothetical protein